MLITYGAGSSRSCHPSRLAGISIQACSPSSHSWIVGKYSTSGASSAIRKFSPNSWNWVSGKEPPTQVTSVTGAVAPSSPESAAASPSPVTSSTSHPSAGSARTFSTPSGMRTRTVVVGEPSHP